MDPTSSRLVKTRINRKFDLCKDILGVLIIIIGIILYSSYGILTRLSMLNTNGISYNTNGVMVIVECGKFIVSFILLITSEGIYQGIKLWRSTSFNEWFIFSLPAIIYAVINNLGFYNLQYMDPATFSVLSQCKIIVTSFLWWCVFKKPLNKQQIISLFSLFCGSTLIAWPHHTNGNNNKQMYIIWPIGQALLSLQVFLSSITGIITEWIYKNYGKNRSVHIDNLSMYFWGILVNLLMLFQYYHTQHVSIMNVKYIINGFNMYTYLIIVVHISLGLCISFILKYFNNIVKLMMYACSIVLTGILTYFIFDLQWTRIYCIGLFAVIVALLLFHNIINTNQFIIKALFIISFLIILIQFGYFDYYIHMKTLYSHRNIINRNETINKIFTNCTFNNTANGYECPIGTYNLNSSLHCYCVTEIE